MTLKLKTEDARDLAQTSDSSTDFLPLPGVGALRLSKLPTNFLTKLQLARNTALIRCLHLNRCKRTITYG
jgi:hypothetical protein